MAKGENKAARRNPFRSLAVRFSTFVCTLVLLVGLTAITVLRQESKRQEQENAETAMKGLGAGYAFAVSRAISSADPARVDTILHSLAATPGIIAVRAEDKTGKVLGAIKGIAAAETVGARYDLPLTTRNGSPAGRLKYTVSAQQLMPAPARRLWTELAGLAAIMALSVPLTVIVVRRIMAPLRQLIDFSEKVGANRLTMQIDIKTGDEFETLGHAFNHMMTRLDASMRRIQRLAYVDPITELPNADHLQRDLRTAITAAQHTGAPGALFLVQLDRLNRIAETLGQEAAYDILTAAAARLASAARAADPWNDNPGAGAAPPMLARLAGEEFAILFPCLPKTVDLRTMANTVAQPFDQGFAWREHKVTLSCILGAAFFPRDGEVPESVIRHARLALNAARETPLRMRFFSRSLDRAATARLNLEKEMRGALEQNQFRAFFQPKIDLRSGRIVGAEALARWVRPDRSVISPAKFIPAAEEMGLIGPVSESILRDACWKAAAWSREGLCARVAVNVSALQFADEGFPEKVLAILDQAGLPPQCLELEITESMAMDDVERAIRTIEPLRAKGVRFAIDDFGTGHSSLAALTRLPFDVLKIDQSFVRGLSRAGSAEALVETILAMAAALNYDAVAEGVETEEEAEFLRRRGCPTAQGFLYSAAVPSAEYQRLLRQGVIQPTRAAITLDPVA
ncbi:MAG TPA: EAL domain-containing protein [Caulobacterales bacterium]|nr:EAL domain-containing protein [Caulobacterales bacterium]